jgi:hypothetical protein
LFLHLVELAPKSDGVPSFLTHETPGMGRSVGVLWVDPGRGILISTVEGARKLFRLIVRGLFERDPPVSKDIESGDSIVKELYSIPVP